MFLLAFVLFLLGLLLDSFSRVVFLLAFVLFLLGLLLGSFSCVVLFVSICFVVTGGVVGCCLFRFVCVCLFAFDSCLSLGCGCVV